MALNESVRVVQGDIFKYRKGAIIIPRATSGTISATFDKGLHNLKVKHISRESSMGSIEILPEIRPGLHIIYATSVNNMSSDYASIAEIGANLVDNLSRLKVEDVYCPLLGTGAGKLSSVLCYIYLALPFLKAPQNFRFNIVVYEQDQYESITPFINRNHVTLAKNVIEMLYPDIASSAPVREILADTNFHFTNAGTALQGVISSNISSAARLKLLDKHNAFKGNFQEFIDAQPDDRQKQFLVLIGELITYLDEKGYNRHAWNKYPDKRSVAHANVRQNIWVQHLINFSITRDLAPLPNNIRNALKYIQNPNTEVPVLSAADRENIVWTFLDEPIAENEFGEVIINYIRPLVEIEPKSEANWSLIASRIMYTQAVRILWDHTFTSFAVPKRIIPASTTSDIQEAQEIPPTVKSKRNPQTYEAKLHDDLFAKEDLLDYQLYAKTIAKFIQSKDTQPPLTIGIFAPWGMGKTSLMRFIQKKLDGKDDNEPMDNVSKANATPDTKLIKSFWKQCIQDGQIIIQETWNSVFKRKPVTETDNNNVNKDTTPVVKEKRLTIGMLIDEINKPPFAKNETGKYSYPTVWFNAWKYENTEQILSGLSFEIINQLVDKLPNRFEKERFYFNLNRSRINERKLLVDVRKKLFLISFNYVSRGLILAGIIALLAICYLTSWNPMVAWLTGSGAWLVSVVIAIARYLKEKSVAASQYVNQFVSSPEYENKLGYFHEVEQDVKNVFKHMVDQRNPCVIFIDDLDRCSSKKVVEVIEAINLFINGDFPHCYFVIGMDAQMVASSVEATYKDISERASGIQKHHGSLGWYFMEKFVQLQFNIPNLNAGTGRQFLKRLLEKTPPATKQDVNTNAIALSQKIKVLNIEDKKAVNELTEQVDQLSDREKITELKSELIERAANEIKDTDDDALTFLENYSQYLCISPRVIKRFANLFRFYRFMQFVNVSGRLNELEEHEIAMMVIITIRWPQLPRLIQWTSEYDFGENSLERAKKIDDNFKTGWSPFVTKSQPQWITDPTLTVFIRDNQIRMERFVELGVW